MSNMVPMYGACHLPYTGINIGMQKSTVSPRYRTCHNV